MTETYHPSYFPEFQNSTREVLVELGNFIGHITNILNGPSIAIACIGVILNVFHLIVLTRKSMITKIINVVLIGIAVSDFIIMTTLIYRYISARKPTTTPECTPPRTYFFVVSFYSVVSIKDVFRRLSTWLGVLMASLRYLILKNALNPKFDFLSHPKFGWKSMMFTLLLSTLMTGFYFMRASIEKYDMWIPGEECGYPANFSAPIYKYGSNGLLSSSVEVFQVMLIIDGLMKMIPAAVLPVLAVLLVKELKKAEISRRKSSTASHVSTNNTSKLVLLMTITCFIAEVPLGISYVLQSVVTEHYGLLYILGDIQTMLSILVILNATVHFFICLGVSSQYRKAAQAVFCIWKKKEVVSKTSVISVFLVRQAKK